MATNKSSKPQTRPAKTTTLNTMMGMIHFPWRRNGVVFRQAEQKQFKMMTFAVVKKGQLKRNDYPIEYKGDISWEEVKMHVSTK